MNNIAKGHRVGYVRVSAEDQNTDRQLDGIALDKIFIDKASGKDTARPQLQAMLQYVREGDTVIVHSMDRLARNLDDLRRLVQQLNAQNVRLEFIKENLTLAGNDSPIANLLLSIMGAVGEFEREIIRQRQREGIALATKRGAYKGRKKALPPDRIKELCCRAAAGEAKSALAREYGINRATLYRYLSISASD